MDWKEERGKVVVGEGGNKRTVFKFSSNRAYSSNTSCSSGVRVSSSSAKFVSWGSTDAIVFFLRLGQTGMCLVVLFFLFRFFGSVRGRVCCW